MNINKKIPILIISIILIIIEIFCVIVISSNIILEIPIINEKIYSIEERKEMNNQQEIYYFEMLDCISFNNLNDFNEMFYFYSEPRPCFTIIEDNNISLNFGNYRKDFYDCEVITKKKFNLLTYGVSNGFGRSNPLKIGCFVEENSFDSNSSFVEIFSIKKPFIMRVN